MRYGPEKCCFFFYLAENKKITVTPTETVARNAGRQVCPVAKRRGI
jgi:hypothetical protein